MTRSGNPKGNPKPCLGDPSRKKFLVCCISSEENVIIIKNDKDGIKAMEEHQLEVHGKAAA